MNDYINEESGGTTFAILQGFNGVKTTMYKLINSNIDNGVIWLRVINEDGKLLEIKTSMANVILVKHFDKQENQNEQGI